MLQPASPTSVLGDFSRGTIQLRGAAYTLSNVGGSYYITESSLAGKTQKHLVRYTLGSRRIQHYLTELADGRIVVLPPSWDVQRRQWFHNMEIVNPEEADGSLVQVWNKNCYSCHVSGEQKNFDLESKTYRTAWRDFGTSCERCHAPGSEHTAARLKPLESTMLCAQCHSLRDMTAEGYRAGSNYFDYFLPILEYGQKMDRDPAYWADGRPRRFSNDAIGLWQSQCFLKGGAVCTTCHANVHDPEVEKNEAVRIGSDGLCLTCHAALSVNVEAHTHHSKGSAGSRCVECHMPRAVFSIRAEIRDHTIGIPTPENTAAYGIPNACNTCHRDRSPAWASQRMNDWYGPASRARAIRRANAFAGARAGQTDSIEPLLELVFDPREGAILRANAAGHLSRFQTDARVQTAMKKLLSDGEPLVRAVTALRIDYKSDSVLRDLWQALDDPVRAVRLGAVFSLVNLREQGLTVRARQRLQAVAREYLNRLNIQSDDGGEQFNRGGFLLLTGDAAGAVDAFRAARNLDPAIRAAYPMACAYVQLGDREAAKRLLREVLPAERDYAAAQQLLARLLSGR